MKEENRKLIAKAMKDEYDLTDTGADYVAGLALRAVSNVIQKFDKDYIEMLAEAMVCSE